MLEKYGVSNETLLQELKAEYTELCEREAEMIKIGAPRDAELDSRKRAVQKKIDELIQ